MVGGLVTKAATPPPGSPTPPSTPPPPPATTAPTDDPFTLSSAPTELHPTSGGDDDDHVSTCPHGVPEVPPGRATDDVVTCMLCEETRDAIGAPMTSQVRPPRIRRSATVATTGVGTLEAVLEREEMTGNMAQGAMGGAGEGRIGAGGMTKAISSPALPSYQYQTAPPLSSRYSMQEGIPGGHDHGQDLRRTQSLKSLFCLPGEELSKLDQRLVQAHECPRVSGRRNALNDPFKMTMPQETRERIQRETQERKTSVKGRVSRYFRSLVEDEPEVDLI